MARAKTPLPVKLVIGILYVTQDYVEKALLPLEEKYGKIDFCSEGFQFDGTHYYAEEMDSKLYRMFIAFEKLIDPGQLADIKLFTNGVEEKCTVGDKRMVNLDPGYLTEAKFILASAKNYQHRIYLQNGIFAEQELRWQSGQWRPFEWTYPDYRTSEYQKIFKEIREIFRVQIPPYKR